MQLQSPAKTTSQENSNAAINSYFKVEEADSSFKQIIPRRKGPIRPIPGVTMYDADQMKKAAFSQFGFSEYADCWTFEMASRPIPFISTDSRPLLVKTVFEKYIKSVLAFIVPRMKPHVQTYNKISNLGYPVFANPPNKMEVLDVFFADLLNFDDSAFKQSHSSINTRLQPESPNKVRVNQFINDDGRIYEKEVTRRQRETEIDKLGTRVGSRVRTVVNPAIINLFNQVWDTMLHRAIMESPLCEANVYNKMTWPGDTSFASFDCKHYERYLGMLVEPYAAAVGGKYGEWLVKLATDPYLVPSDTWKTCCFVTP